MSTAEYQRRWRHKQALASGREPGRIGRPITQPCGTVAAYKRHRRRGEEPCEPCKTAHSTQQREWYEQRKAQRR